MVATSYLVPQALTLLIPLGVFIVVLIAAYLSRRPGSL